MGGKTPYLEGRNGEMWRLWCEGRTQAWIADQFGITQSAVHHALAKVRDNLGDVVMDDERTRSLEMLHELRAGALEVWRMVAAPVTAGKDGTVVYDPETREPVRDHGGRLRALETALKVDARIAQLLGLDAATKHDHTVHGESEAATALAAEAARRVHGETS